jgi:hypothetical protein
MMTLFEP